MSLRWISRTGFILLIAALISSSAVLAAGEGPGAEPLMGLVADSMEVSVKPEFDQSDVLVIYDAILVNNSSKGYSGKVVMWVPRDINLGQTCELNEKNEHLCQLPSVEDKGDYKLVSWNVGRELKPGERYHAYMEFYYNPIVRGDDKKSFDYEFVPVFPVRELTLNVVQPLRSSEFKLDPSPQGTTAWVMSGANFTVAFYRWTNVTPGKPVRAAVSYVKADDRPSVAKTTGVPAPGAGGGTAGRSADWGLIGLVVIAVAVMGFFVLYGSGGRRASRAPAKAPARDKRRGEAKDRRAKASPADASSERRRARQMLLEGKISEETYKQIISDLDSERKGK